MATKGIKIALFGLLLVLVSLFFMGVCILNQGNACGGVSLAFLIVGAIVTVVGLLWDVKF